MTTPKDVTEMTDEELEAEIARLQSVPIPSPASPKKPKRMDASPRKRKSIFDQITGG